jgi:murein DD-endopeptidase MepM/ murein hydrolase activator NlpD
MSLGLGLVVASATTASLSAVTPMGDPGLPEAPKQAPVADALTAGPIAGPLTAVGEGAVAVPPPPPPVRVTKGVIESGETLSSSLREHGIGAEIVHLLRRELHSHFDFRRAQPGHSYRLVQDEDGRVLDFRYSTSEVVSYRMRLDGDRYQVGREEAELRPQSARIAGVVTSSLFDAIRQLGEDPQLAGDFADIFAWDIDFSHSVQPGDEFRILYERLYRSDDEGEQVYVRPGRILAAHYRGSAGDHTALYFEEDQGRGGYYRPDGTSVEREFLVAPLRRARISSRYSSARRHPILRITRPHHGIDYAAPVGTPVWAVADGKVIYRGWAGGFGNLVKIRHARGYVSYYAHLSHFVSNLKVGQTVRQKQLIGYVGQTGLATGPHVCFRIAHNGSYVDPTKLRAPAGDPVSPAARYQFWTTRDGLLAALDAETLVAASDEAL